MDAFRIPVEHPRALAVYYERALGCSFVLNGQDFGHDEVFHHGGFLPMVVDVASVLSARIFGAPLRARYSASEQSLLGRRVELEDENAQPVILLLSRASELIFSPERGKTVELYPMFEYAWLPPEQRRRATWQPSVI
ncbi:hypothetical protein [Cupriavidus oxalaticus]|uniref:Uncharacterized protein n=1 Tax=Cupriavidus oxalaticus TaxID=96344 RepID=A0A4P7LU96_9BURK|nr:hypothetical protein [Cupriavidus oxalaticus]QBY56031.1 hypothetical protein E0W60_33795 [Cupriavidus oxalaticus]